MVSSVVRRILSLIWNINGLSLNKVVKTSRRKTPLRCLCLAGQYDFCLSFISDHPRYVGFGYSCAQKAQKLARRLQASFHSQRAWSTVILIIQFEFPAL